MKSQSIGYLKMKRVAVLMLTLCLMTFNLYAQEETFNIDRSHSVIAFSIKIAGGFSEVEGSFTDFKGSATVESGDYTLKSANVEIQATSINTGTEGRDNHLRTDDFFDVENFPTITFNSTGVAQSGADYEVEGDFTMHGVTKRITIPFKRSHEPAMVWIFGVPNIIYEGATTVDRETFGIKATARWNSIVAATGDMAMSDEVTIRLKIITRGQSPVQVLTKAVTEGGVEGFMEAYNMQEQKYPGEDIFSENTFPSVGRGLRRQKNNPAIVEVYKIWVEKYPESSNAHYSLGEAYMTVEDAKSAKKQFKKSLELDPNNEDAKTQLAKMDE